MDKTNIYLNRLVLHPTGEIKSALRLEGAWCMRSIDLKPLQQAGTYIHIPISPVRRHQSAGGE